MRLAALYARTKYRVLLPRPLVLRPGRLDTAVSEALAAQGIRSWFVLTPCNPRSKRLPRFSNQVRLRQLRRLAEQRGLLHFPSSNHDARGHWPDEPGLLLANTRRETALRLGRRFRQNALLAGTARRRAVMVWLTSG